MIKYAVVVENIPASNYGAYVPDLPGCVSACNTLEGGSAKYSRQLAYNIALKRQRSCKTV